MQTKSQKTLADLKRQLFIGVIDKKAVSGIFLTVFTLFLILMFSLLSGDQGEVLFLALLKGGGVYALLAAASVLISFGKEDHSAETPWLVLPAGKKIRELSKLLTEISQVARRDGTAELDPEKLTQDAWVRHHLKLIIEGMDPLDLERILRAQYEVLLCQVKAAEARATRLSLGLRATGLVTAIWIYFLSPALPAGALLWVFFSECVYHLILKEWVRRIQLQAETVTVWHEVVHEGLVGIARGAAPTALSEVLQTLLLKL